MHDDLRSVLRTMQRVDFLLGAMLVRQEGAAASALIIGLGKAAELAQLSGEVHILLAELGLGSVLGEMALIARIARQ
mgnify:CR=1 FL=1